MNRASEKSRLILVLLMTTMGVVACSKDMDDLDAYINQIKARSGGVIEPLPEIKPYEVFTYVADSAGLRSPFVPDTAQASPGVAGGGTRPDTERSREFLEQYPLDTMKMVGTLQLGGVDYGLVRDPAGLIHRVVPGNYMGQNDGRVVNINESGIELIEIISDGIGGYLEREAGIGLAD
ncbi:MAG: pilus assembly protein PilP [Gammaproteobacteria bacterium]|nr:pilus assembly protein PilP [Gammaproteobacteria bacterium]